jgi:hypothetical protein
MSRSQNGWVNGAAVGTANTVERTATTQFPNITPLTAGDWLQIRGSLNVTVPGTVALSWAPNAVVPDAVILDAGSYMKFTRLD